VHKILFGTLLVVAIRLATPAAAAVESAPQPIAASPPAAAAIGPKTAVAPAPAKAMTPELVIASAEQRLTQLQNQAQATSDDKQLSAMAAQASALEAQADRLVATQRAALASLDHQLRPLVSRRRLPMSERPRLSEMLARKKALTAALAPVQSLDRAANATSTFIAQRRREGFSARLLERSASPLAPAFWASLAEAAGLDISRLEAMAINAAEVAEAAPEPRGILSLALGVLVALTLLFPVRRALEAFGQHRLGSGSGRIRHTAYALWLAAVDTGAPGLAVAAIRLSAEWGGLLSEKMDALAGAGVVAVVWGAAILALGRALFAGNDSVRRVIATPDASAARVGRLLWAVAVVTGAGFLLARLNYLAAASVAATIATNCIVSLAYAGIAALILLALRREPEETRARESEDEPSAVWSLVCLSLTLAIIATVGSVLAGYTALAALISGQIFWLSVLAAVSFILLRFIDDLCGLLFSPDGWASRMLQRLFTLRRSTIAQAGVLVSAALQLLLLIGVLTLALTPFGQSGDLLFSHASRLGQPVRIGSATISPSAVAAGLAALVVGMGLVHLLREWVNRRYLPATDWDAGLRNSVSTGVGYIGVAIAVLCALSAMGLGFAQIALVASALSVGIGFGLQQVVQNFVSGVILLIERPVKVGDWVNVDGVEGDIRRIRVRATEIQTFDRTTVIVPNSDLITKQVQNKTHGDPLGRIQLQIAIAKPADARRAADLIVRVAKTSPDILGDPQPAVYIDSLAAGGAVNLMCHVFVATPRDSYRVRSDLFFDLLEAFQGAGIAFVGAVGP